MRTQLQLPCNTTRHHSARVTLQHARKARRRVAASSTASAAAPASLPRSADPSRILFVGSLPAQNSAQQLEQQLTDVCRAAGCPPTRVQVAPFDSESQRTRFPPGWLHKGFALLAFQDAASVEAAAAAIRTQGPAWGAAATLGPAKKAPADWPAHLTYDQGELTALQQQQAVLEVRRAHNRRQRQRQSQRLVDSVEQLLSGLQQPFGSSAQQLYQPLLTQQACQQLQQLASAVCTAAVAGAAVAGGGVPDSSERGAGHGTSGSAAAQAAVDGTTTNTTNTTTTSSATNSSSSSAGLPPRLLQAIRWPVLLNLLQQQQQQRSIAGPIQLAAAACPSQVEARLLLDWAQVPLLLDPAFGGRLADADVVRAGRGRMNLRALRKRVQLESFALLLWELTQHTLQPAAAAAAGDPSSRGAQPAASLHVVEFGSGSGNLILPLAHFFPHFSFTAVDMKPSAVQLLQQRVEGAGLVNVAVQLGRIEEYAGPADVVLALHACGSATDWALMQAAARRAAFIVSPCCIGKINSHNNSSSSSGGSSGSTASGQSRVGRPQTQQQDQLQQQGQQDQQQRPKEQFLGADRVLQYPRSQQLQQQMAAIAQQVLQQQQQQQQQQAHVGAARPVLNRLQEVVLGSSGSLQQQCRGLFSILAASADYSHTEAHSHPQLAGLAKTNVEWDRGVAMREAGYQQVSLLRLLQPELTAKNDVLVGVCCGSGDGGVSWPFWGE